MDLEKFCDHCTEIESMINAHGAEFEQAVLRVAAQILYEKHEDADLASAVLEWIHESLKE